MTDDVGEIAGREPVVDWHHNRADLRHRVERLQLRVRVRRDVGDAIARLDAEPLQRGRPPIAPVEELLVAEMQAAVDDRFAAPVERPRPACEFQRREWDFHESEKLKVKSEKLKCKGSRLCPAWLRRARKSSVSRVIPPCIVTSNFSLLTLTFTSS